MFCLWSGKLILWIWIFFVSSFYFYVLEKCRKDKKKKKGWEWPFNMLYFFSKLWGMEIKPLRWDFVSIQSKGRTDLNLYYHCSSWLVKSSRFRKISAVMRYWGLHIMEEFKRVSLPSNRWIDTLYTQSSKIPYLSFDASANMDCNRPLFNLLDIFCVWLVVELCAV